MLPSIDTNIHLDETVTVAKLRRIAIGAPTQSGTALALQLHEFIFLSIFLWATSNKQATAAVFWKANLLSFSVETRAVVSRTLFSVLLSIFIDLLLIWLLCPQHWQFLRLEAAPTIYAQCRNCLKDIPCDVLCMRLGCGPLKHIASIDTGIRLREIRTGHPTLPLVSQLGCPCGGQRWRFSKLPFRYSWKNTQQQLTQDVFRFVSERLQPLSKNPLKCGRRMRRHRFTADRFLLNTYTGFKPSSMLHVWVYARQPKMHHALIKISTCPCGQRFSSLHGFMLFFSSVNLTDVLGGIK